MAEQTGFAALRVCSKRTAETAIAPVQYWGGHPVHGEQVLRDLERARMTAEDFRQGNAPHFDLTWRQWGENICRTVEEMNDAMAQIAIEARGDMTTPDGGIPIWNANNIRRLTMDFVQESEEESEEEG